MRRGEPFAWRLAATPMFLARLIGSADGGSLRGHTFSRRSLMAASPFRSRRRTDRGSASRADRADRLSGVPPVPHDSDERQTREDLQPHGSQLFKIPVPVPKFLIPRRKRGKP